MANAGTVLGYAENYLKFDRSSVGVPGLEETQLLAVCNQAVKEYHNAFSKGGEPSSILRKETGYTLVADTDLDGAVSSGDTTADVTSATNLDSSGAIAIWDDNVPDYVEYTGVSTNQLTGVTGIDYSHEDEDIVSKLYALPSDFHDFRTTVDSRDGVMVDGKPYFHSSGMPQGNTFTIYDNGTTKYLHFPRSLTGDCYVTYNANPTTIDDTSDTVDVPTEDEWFVVWRIVEYSSEVLGLNADQTLRARERAEIILSNSLKRRNIGKRPHIGRTRRSPHFSRTDVFD